MKKICLSFTIFIIIVSFSISVLAAPYDNAIYKKREKAYKDALAELLEPYKKEDALEDQRITDYRYSGFGISHEDEKYLKVSISYWVDPYLEESTFWSNSGHNGICFAEFLIEDGEYILEKISLEPENYDKFLEGLEEYKNTRETQIVETEENTNQTKNEDNTEITNITNIIYIVSAIVLVIVIIVFIKSKNKKVNKN